MSNASYKAVDAIRLDREVARNSRNGESDGPTTDPDGHSASLGLYVRGLSRARVSRAAQVRPASSGRMVRRSRVKKEMPLRRHLRHWLADLIEFHDREGGTPERARAGGSPQLRLQDWRVVEKISVGSTDYVLLRRVEAPKNGVDSLTARERDALRHASTGASNKEIAHEMGISVSTVGVLLLRAARKLGAIDRNDLIRVYLNRRP